MRTRLVALVLLSAAALSACGNSSDDGSTTTVSTETSAEVAPASPADALWGRTFFSTDVSGTPIPGGGPLEVAFPQPGQIAMSAGCNRGVGSVELAGGIVNTGPIATTMMACPGDIAGADKWMTDFFAARPTWKLDAETLTLVSPETTVSLTAKTVTSPDRPVIGTTWVVDTLISPDAVSTSTALETSAPTLTIAENGRATGTTGCNRFNGPAQLGNGTITFGPLVTTHLTCPTDVTEVERAVLAVLDGEVTYAIDADTMKLMRPDGLGLGLRGE
ncbi:META domain-containing protein [Rhodococcus sp. ABRD24]|uniref:META domain-containing protein n=1 Tax=Rhodococcus sp. ABRD24 TaxID=2507582 RepID=UPI00103CD6C9|nr:META domain-containing protein [Rhodococcus sp. ABRD24]QBJ95209.1 META domain-containing protein [Rhodococcus sp. ABRD24]